MSKKLGGSGTGRATPSDNDRLPQPQNAKSGRDEVHSEQLRPGRITKHGVVDDYAGDGKSYGVSGNKTLASNRKSPGHHGI